MAGKSFDAEAFRPGRRQMVVAGLGLTAIGAGAAIERAMRGGGSSGRKALELAAHDTMGMRSLEIPVVGHLESVEPGLWRTPQLDASEFTMLGFIWPSGAAVPDVEVRARVARVGVWDQWTSVPRLADLPDLGTSEASAHDGTQVVWTGRVNGLQFEVRGSALPAGMKLVLLHPTRQRGDRAQNLRLVSSLAPDGLRPSILTRAEWGADEAWRNGSPAYCSTVQQVHVHHTVSANDYAAADVPAMIRGMYRYHTHNLGWADLAYNFLVDRFGRVWEGRAGGADRFVQGAHTRGFNSTSVGISVIGNFQEVAPTSAVLEGVASIAAWKVGLFGGKPLESTTVTSGGSDRFRSGTKVTLPVIDGHRDTNETACPGNNLYVALPRIRDRVRQLILDEWGRQHGVTAVSPPALSGSAVATEALTVRPGEYSPDGATTAVQWYRDGVPITGAVASRIVPGLGDVGARLIARITASSGQRAPLVQELDAGVVRARPSLRVRARARGGGVVTVAVRVVPPQGLGSVPTGTVRVRVRRRLQEVNLVDGFASARFESVTRGAARVRVRYMGSTYFTEAVLPAPREITVT